MTRWIACGDSFIQTDLVRWKEAVYDRPTTQFGRKRRRGKYFRIGEREVAAEVLSDPRADDLITLLVRGCRTVSLLDGWEMTPIKLETEIKRKKATLLKGHVERLKWSDENESAREAVVASYPLVD